MNKPTPRNIPCVLYLAAENKTCSYKAFGLNKICSSSDS